ncbi:hypothetical protein EBQ93_03910 [bacterium]|nr:hypothetical protein [bacterium]
MKLIRMIIMLGVLSGAAWYGMNWFDTMQEKIYPDTAVYNIDPLFSHPYKKKIQTFIDAEYKKNKFPAKIVTQLEKEFIGIKHVTVQVTDDTIVFSLDAQQPLCRMQDEYVLTALGNIVPQSLYTKSALEKMPRITYPHDTKEHKVHTKLLEFFRKCPDWVLKNYHIHWKSWHEIELVHMQDDTNSIKIKADQIITQGVIDDCIQAKTKVAQSRPIKKKDKDKRWVCDVRFDKQMIISQR